MIIFSVMHIACFHKTKTNRLFHFQDLTDNCNIPIKILVFLRVFLGFLKINVLAMSETMLTLLSVFNAIYIPKQ